MFAGLEEGWDFQIEFYGLFSRCSEEETINMINYSTLLTFNVIFEIFVRYIGISYCWGRSGAFRSHEVHLQSGLLINPNTIIFTLVIKKLSFF